MAKKCFCCNVHYVNNIGIPVKMSAISEDGKHKILIDTDMFYLCGRHYFSYKQYIAEAKAVDRDFWANGPVEFITPDGLLIADFREVLMNQYKQDFFVMMSEKHHAGVFDSRLNP